MKVEVRSKEIVRPSSPTPESLKNYKLSFMDQLALNVKVPSVFFYDSPISKASHHAIDELKKSLSKTLSLMYPLAGRLKEDKATIECNDQGVEFIVADVAENMSCLLDNPEMEKIKQLIPTAKVYEPQPVGKVLVAIQVSRFSCGGMAVGFFILHAVADGSAVATFFETWGSINRGVAVNASGFVSDQPSIFFPPLTDTSTLERTMRMVAEAVEQAEKSMVVKRFVVPANAMAQLREELKFKDNNTGTLQRPSRTEALTALVWAAVINAIPPTQTVTLSCMVNLRSRMEPPLPPNCLGSLAYGTTVQWEAKDGGAVTAAQLVQRIRDAFRAVNDGMARKMYGEGGFFRAFLARGDEIVLDKDSSSSTLYTSSLIRQPHYGVDFGWGKPRLVVNMLKNSTVIWLDGVNGGVDVWMGLPKEIMDRLTQDHNFLAYVSGFPKPKL